MDVNRCARFGVNALRPARSAPRAARSTVAAMPLATISAMPAQPDSEIASPNSVTL